MLKSYVIIIDNVDLESFLKRISFLFNENYKYEHECNYLA